MNFYPMGNLRAVRRLLRTHSSNVRANKPNSGGIVVPGVETVVFQPVSHRAVSAENLTPRAGG
jgi:hypothetical protein